MISVAIIDDQFREVEPIIRFLEKDDECSSKYFKEPHSKEINEWISSQQDPVVVMLDLIFDGDELGDDVFNQINNANPDVPIFIFTSTQDLTIQDKYENLGCYDFITKNSINARSIPVLLKRIKEASSAGHKFHQRFTEIREAWKKVPGMAILQLNELLSTGNYSNLMAFQVLNDWIKQYVKRGLENSEIGMPCLLSIWEESCREIGNIQRDGDVDHELDLCAVYIHSGKMTEAKSILKNISGKITEPKKQGRRFVNLALGLCSLESKTVPSADDIGRPIDITPSALIYNDFLEWSYHCNGNAHLWDQAVSEYFNYWRSVGSIDKSAKLRILSQFSNKLPYDVATASIMEKRDEELISFIYSIFLDFSPFEHEDLDLQPLYYCYRYLFWGRRDNWLKFSDSETICTASNELSTRFCLDDQPSAWIEFVDDKIVQTGTTDDKIIQDVLSRPGKSTSITLEHLYKILQHLLQCGKQDRALEIIKTQEWLFNGSGNDILEYAAYNSPYYQLYRFGELFEKYKDYESSKKFLAKAVEGYLRIIKERRNADNDTLYYLGESLKILKKMGENVASYDEIYERYSTGNIRVPLPWDNKKIAIGGNNNIRDNIDKFKNTLGGEFVYYNGVNVKECQKLQSSLLTGGFDIVVHVTGCAKHCFEKTVMSSLERINQKAGTKRIRSIRVPINITNPISIIRYIKSEVLG